MEKRGFWIRFVAVFVRPLLKIFTRRSWRGQIPQGPVILVPNHISYADPLIVAHYIYDHGHRVPHFLAKESLFTIPVIGYILRRCKQIPVKRRTREASHSLDAARSALAEGAAVVVYPEGTCTRDPNLWPMKGKTGAARLALMTGAPVVPVAQWGAQRLVDPFTRKITLRNAQVSVSAGQPVDLASFKGSPVSAELLAAATEVIMRRLREDVALLRGEPAPAGDLYEPPR